jgi:nitrite reductase/ring-hydroxylating ferredoxin subunit
MERHVQVARVDDLEPGSMMMVEVDDKPVLLANVDGEFYAVSDICTHEEYNLSEGSLEGNEVECPGHSAFFNLKTGDVTDGPAEEPIKTYSVQIEDGTVFIESA